MSRTAHSLLATLIFLSSLPVLASAADASATAAGAPASGVLGSVEAAPGADPALRNVVVGALSLQFMRRNATFETAPPDNLTKMDAAAQGLRQAAERHQQFFLFGEYSTSSKELTLSVQLYDAQTGAKLSSASVSGRIGLAMDSVVAKVLDQVLAGLTLEPVIQPLPPAQPGDRPTDISPGTTPGPGARQPSPAEPPEGGPGASPPAATVTGTRSSQRAPSRIALTSGVAPFIPLGSGTYADLGILATLSAVIRFPLGPGVFGAGLLGGLGAMNAAVVVSTATLLLVPLGVELSYSMNEGAFPGILFHVSAGPALMSVTTSYEGTLMKPVPYLLAGMRVDVPFTPFLGMALEAAWIGFFESASLVIMGFSPEVSVYVRF